MTEKLPDGWAWAKIGDVCHINPRWFDEPPEDDEHLSFVPMAEVEAGTGKMQCRGSRSYAGLKKKTLTPFQEDDVIFAKITPCMENGKIALARGLMGGRAFGSTEFIVLRCSRALLPQYLMHFLLQVTFRKEAERNMSGAAGQRRVPKSFISGYSIPLPPVVEQRRIVDALEAEISRLEAAEYQLAQAETRLAILRSRFIESIFLGGKFSKRGSVKIEPAGVEDGVVSDLPKGWKWRRLHEIADVVGGVTKNSKNQDNASYVEVPYLRVANVQKGEIDLAHVHSVRVSQEKASQLELLPGDVLLNEGGDRDKLGRGWIWEGQIPGCIHQNHVFRARIRDGVLHPKLLSWHANEFGQRWCFVNGRQSVNLASISLSKIKLLPVPVPPRDMQEEIVKKVEEYLLVFDRVVTQLRSSRVRAKTLRQSLLAAAFTGKLVPQDPSDEPASVLLERIRAERAFQQTTKRGRKVKPAKSPVPTSDDPRPVPPGEQTALEF